MRSHLKINSWLWSFLFASLILFSCEDKMKEHYEEPPWLEGSAIEYLQGKGNYTIFLDALEKTDFSSIVGGTGLITVMAPDDDAFTTYLNTKGYSSINEMPETELKKLIGYHLVDFKFNKELLANFTPYGRSNYNPTEKGLYYKQRTKASSPITKEDGFEPNGKPRTYSVFHRNLYLPILSNYMFDTREIDAKYNYEFLYPNSTWTGGDDGFNISEASVQEYEVATVNGFIYLIDRVLDPLETIHESLKSEGNYSNFLTLYDLFSSYEYDEDLTDNYGNGDSLFIHMHIELPPIASEWPIQNESDWPILTRDAYSVFVPDNSALESFFQGTWAPYYSSLSEVNPLSVLFLLYNHTYSGDLAFPDNIKNGDIITYFGTPVIFDPDADVIKSQLCTNGVYYGLNSVQTPPMFNSITGPVFRDPKYKMFLHMVAYSGEFLSLSSEAINYTIFIPSDEAIEKSGYYDLEMRYYDPTPGRFGDEAVQINDQGYGDMSNGQMINFVNSHVATGLLTEVDGIKVYKGRNSYTYLFVDGNTVASNKIFNEENSFAPIQLIDGNWTNGNCYSIDTVILSEDIRFRDIVGFSEGVPYLTDYTEFSKKLTSAGMLPLNAPLNFILDKYMVFIPSNEAILNAAPGTFPTNPDSLATYLKYYFIPVPDNDISDYPFPGAGIQGEFITYQDFNALDTIPPSSLTLKDWGTSMTLTTPGGQTVNITSNIPKVYKDCAVYSIDALIEP